VYVRELALRRFVAHEAGDSLQRVDDSLDSRHVPGGCGAEASATVPMLFATRRSAFGEYFSHQLMYRSGAQIIEDFVQVDGTGLPKV
jgi:hypothetical protein